MTDRRDGDEELARLLSELEETLTELRSAIDEEDLSGEGSRQRGRSEGAPWFRPPRLRDILRFTEQQTIPTLVMILEVNIRLLRLAGATLRAIDPERSAVRPDEDSASQRAIDAGRRLSTDRLTAGLTELQDALAGTDAPNPESQRLLEDAQRLSADVRERLQAGRQGREPRADSQDRDSGVSIDVEEASRDDEADATESRGDTPGPDVDAELDSIREEVRGDETDDDLDGAEPEHERGGEDDLDGAEPEQEPGGNEPEHEQSGDEGEDGREAE